MGRKVVIDDEYDDDALDKYVFDDDIDIDMADEYDYQDGSETIDFSNLQLKPNHESKPLWVCPNFHVYLDTSSRFYDQATDFLTAIAEPISRPQFIHEYKITDSSLYGAVSVGLDTDGIIRKLASLSKMELSEDIKAHIRNKTATYGKVKLVLKNKAKNESIKRHLLSIPEIDDCRLSDDELEMEIEKEENYDELEENLNVLNTDPDLDDENENEIEEEDEEVEKKRKLVSFPIRDGTETQVKQVSQNKNYPMIEEYDFRNDTHNRNIHIRLAPSTHVRPYQERCLNKMFGNGRARSGLIVLPCGAGKTLVGITAAATIKKGCVVVCNSDISAYQWRDSFLSFCDIKSDQIRIMVKNTTEPLTNPCILVTTYYQLIRGKKIRQERDAMLKEIEKREWGLLVLDEVHVCPAESFKTVVSTVKAHCKLGLTATLVREDNKIGNLDFLIGPKLYEANWMDLTNKGYLSPVRCLEVWCDMDPSYYREYLSNTSYEKHKILGVMNPEKIKALAFLLDLHKKRGDKILVFCDSIYPLERFKEIFREEVLTGSSSEAHRKDVLTRFRQTNSCNVVFLSKIGDTSIDLPEATVLIQVQGQEGSRRQEAQRLGRILRPKMGLSAGTQAFFYTLVSRDTKEVGNAINRQRYVMAQGYTYKILVNITKGLTKEQIESINGYKELCTQAYIEDSLRQIKETNVSEKDKLERDALSLSAGSRRSSTSMSRSHKTIMRNIKTVASFSGATLANYSEKRRR